MEEEPLKVGIGIIPEGELIDVGYDSLPVELYTVDNIGVNTKGITVSPLGSINDEVFGALKAEFMTDFLPISEVFFRDSITDNITVDSLILQLIFDTYEGDSSLVSFDIHELNDSIVDTLNSDFIVPTSMFSPVSLIDKVIKKKQDTLLIKLTDVFAQKFLNPKMVDDSAYYYIPYFKRYFRGLYFSTDFYTGTGGGMLNINRTKSSLWLYTSEIVGSATVRDSIEMAFIHTSYPSLSYHLNLYNEIRGTDITNDTLNSEEKVYMRSLAGTRVLVKIPDLKERRKVLGGNVVVNRAELILPVNLSSIVIDPYPSKLGLRSQSDNGILMDDNPTYSSSVASVFLTYFRGYYESTKKQYSFDIGNHIHYYFQSDTNSTTFDDSFYLYPSETNSPGLYERYKYRQVVLRGALSEEAKPYLRIIYSEIPK